MIGMGPDASERSRPRPVIPGMTNAALGDTDLVPGNNFTNSEEEYRDKVQQLMQMTGGGKQYRDRFVAGPYTIYMPKREPGQTPPFMPGIIDPPSLPPGGYPAPRPPQAPISVPGYPSESDRLVSIMGAGKPPLLPNRPRPF